MAIDGKDRVPRQMELGFEMPPRATGRALGVACVI
jgi:hypothetical protein